MEQGPAMTARSRPPMVGAGSGKADDGVFFFHVAAGEFVGFGDADDFRNAGERFQVAAVDLALIAGDADGGALGSGKGMGTETQLHNVVADRLDLFRRSLRFHDNQHDYQRFSSSL